MVLYIHKSNLASDWHWQLLSEVNTFSHTINFCERWQESAEDTVRRAFPEGVGAWPVSCFRLLILYANRLKVRSLCCHGTHGVCAILETISWGKAIGIQAFRHHAHATTLRRNCPVSKVFVQRFMVEVAVTLILIYIHPPAHHNTHTRIHRKR